MRVALVTIVLLLGAGAGTIFLQIFLSEKESKWAGLGLPLITLFISLLTAVGTAFYMIGDTSAVLWTGVYIFLLYNIPTAVLLAIYFACRGKRSRRRDLEKMSAQDLE